MAGIPDIDAHKIYIGQENPRENLLINLHRQAKPEENLGFQPK